MVKRMIVPGVSIGRARFYLLPIVTIAWFFSPGSLCAASLNGFVLDNSLIPESEIYYVG
jgi:hypothetical protein